MKGNVVLGRKFEERVRRWSGKAKRSRIAKVVLRAHWRVETDLK